MKDKIKRLIKFIILIVLIIAVVYVFRFSPIADQLTVEKIKDFVERFGFLSFLIFIIMYSVGTLVSVPGVILTFVGAILFGTILGTIINLLGATLGATFAFFGAKLLGRDFVQGLLKGKLDTLNKQIGKYAFKGILFCRLVPAFPFIGINYGCGLLNVKFKDYFFATLIGMIPGTFVYTYLFATVGERALMGGLTAKDFLTPQILIPIISFILLLTLPIVYKKVKKKD